MRPIVEIYFYPRPPRGGRHNSLNGWATDIKFLSTPSARRATKRVTQKGGDRRFLSTPSARRATSRRAIRSLMGAYFYPRPPRGGRPIGKKCLHKFWVYFYPRPPRGGRPLATQLASCCCEFLSTPSARRATIPADKDGVRIAISIHALREEGDQGLPLNRTRFEIFLSTPSARRATYHLQPCFRQWGYFYPRPPRGGRP